VAWDRGKAKGRAEKGKQNGATRNMPAGRVRGVVRSYPSCEVYLRPPGGYMIAPPPIPRNKRNIKGRSPTVQEAPTQ
jgi:hypothetical protein